MFSISKSDILYNAVESSAVETESTNIEKITTVREITKIEPSMFLQQFRDNFLRRLELSSFQDDESMPIKIDLQRNQEDQAELSECRGFITDRMPSAN